MKPIILFLAFCVFVQGCSFWDISCLIERGTEKVKEAIDQTVSDAKAFVNGAIKSTENFLTEHGLTGPQIFDKITPLLDLTKLNEIENLVKNMGILDEIDQLIKDGGLQNITSIIESSVVPLIAGLEDNVVSTIQQVAEEVGKKLEIFDKYEEVKSFYETNIKPTVRDADKFFREFDFTSEVENFGKLLIPEEVIEFINNPDTILMNAVRNAIDEQKSNFENITAIKLDLVENFKTLTQDEDLKKQVIEFAETNRLTKAIKKLYEACEEAVRMISAFVDERNKLNSQFNIPQQFEQLISSGELKNRITSWYRNTSFEDVQNLLDDSTLLERYKNLTSDEEIMNQAELFFGKGTTNTVKRIVSIATNEKLHESIQQLVTTDKLIRNIQDLVDSKIISSLQNTFSNGKVIEIVTKIIQNPVILKKKFEQIGDMSHTVLPRVARSTDFKDAFNMESLKQAVKTFEKLTDVPTVFNQTLFLLKNQKHVKQAISFFEKGEKVISKFMENGPKSILKSIGDLLGNKEHKETTTKLGNKFELIMIFVRNFNNSFFYRKYGEILGTIEAVEEVIEIAKSRELRAMVSDTKTVLDNVDLVRELSAVAKEASKLESFSQIGASLEAPLKRFGDKIIGSLQKMADNDYIKNLRELSVTDVGSFIESLSKLTEMKSLVANMDVLSDVADFVQDSSLFDGVVSLVSNIDIAEHVAHLGKSGDRIVRMLEALTNTQGMKKLVHLIARPQLVDNMIGFYLDPQYIRMLIDIFTNPEVMDTVMEVVKSYADIEAAAQVIEFVCRENIANETITLLEKHVVLPMTHYLKHLPAVSKVLHIVSEPERIRDVLRSMRPEWIEKIENFFADDKYVKTAFDIIEAIPTLTQLPELFAHVDVLDQLFETDTEGGSISNNIEEMGSKAAEAVADKLGAK